MTDQITPPEDLGISPESAKLSDAVQAFYLYWREKRQGAMPAKADLSIADMAPYLPNLVFVEPRFDPEDFRFRLIGTEVVRKSRKDRTGQCFGDNPNMDRTSQFWRRYAWVRDNQQPLFSKVEYVGTDKAVRNVEDLILPLRATKHQPMSIVTFVNYIGFAS
ncbi:MAG: PAS domain-containing protein [Alphaproteobacteria bacterium]|nr:PAS domain-containing protein [Alphaproteobacteria bacterium]